MVKWDMSETTFDILSLGDSERRRPQQRGNLLARQLISGGLGSLGGDESHANLPSPENRPRPRPG